MRPSSIVAPPDGVLESLNNDETIDSNVGIRLPSSSNPLPLFSPSFLWEFVMHFTSLAAV
jgi:hypothetical protein